MSNDPIPEILYMDRYDIKTCREHPDKLFVFGDNMKRKGRGGQAVIRYEPNAFGIATKRCPSMASEAFFSDAPDEMATLMGDLRRLYKLNPSVIVFPSFGIGTGLARMKEVSPEIFQLMNDILLNHFGIINPKT